MRQEVGGLEAQVFERLAAAATNVPRQQLGSQRWLEILKIHKSDVGANYLTNILTAGGRQICAAWQRLRPSLSHWLIIRLNCRDSLFQEFWIPGRLTPQLPQDLITSKKDLLGKSLMLKSFPVNKANAFLNQINISSLLLSLVLCCSKLRPDVSVNCCQRWVILPIPMIVRHWEEIVESLYSKGVWNIDMKCQYKNSFEKYRYW